MTKEEYAKKIEEISSMNLTDKEKQNLIELLENKKQFREKLNEKVKQTMQIMGFILSGLGGGGYLVTIFMIVTGGQDINFELVGKDGLFFLIGFSFGLLIRTGFYLQGSKYAKMDSQTIINQYNDLKQKNKKETPFQSYEFRMALSFTLSTVFSVAWFLVSSLGVIYLAGFDGMDNWIYFWNALSNLFLFTGFGFLGLNSAYEKYIIFKLPVIKERIRKLTEEPQKELAKDLPNARIDMSYE